MAADTTTTVILTDATRIGCSVNGNPTWMLHTDQGDFRTMSDSGCSYEVSNVLPRRHRGELGQPLVLTLTPAGRVRYFTRDGDMRMVAEDGTSGQHRAGCANRPAAL